ncbi:MAG: hypothetical protein IT480_03625 [Gammaproteobacteria bacterium]|nr:hypothetical protein [Gammaproteobacteria bacterium]
MPVTTPRGVASPGRGVAQNYERGDSVPAQLSSFALVDAPAQPALPVRMPGADELQVLTSLDEVRAATNAVASTGQRLISIFTPDMEPALYDQPAFLEIIKRFVLGHSFAKVRVLVRDHSRVSTSSNRFIGMARRLSSYLEIRQLATRYRDITAAYCIADDRAIVYRLRADRWEGITAPNSPPVTRQYLMEFDACWQASLEQQHEARSARR